MFKKISDFFYSISTGRVVLVLFVMYLLFNAVILPYCSERIDPGGTVKVLDLAFGYHTQEAKQVLEAFGEEGRKTYFFVDSVIDIAYPIIYTLFNILLFGFFLRQFFPKGTKYQWINLVPLITMLFDFGENIHILRLIRQYPDLHSSTVLMASVLGMIKWILGISIMLFSVLLFIAWMIKKYIQRKTIS